VSVCIFRADEVLLIERGKAPGIGRWAPVGGGIEPGETAEAAALREVAEEVAVTIRLIGRVGTREIRPDPVPTEGPRRILLEVFAADWVAGEPTAGSDAAAARFVAVDRLSDLPLMPGVEPWIRAARRLRDGILR
jgi:8-oxo-dGTP diphosphatase